jgi:hypothetical protein
MEIAHPQVAETDMDHTRGRSADHDSVGKVSVFRNDRQVPASGVMPNLAVAPSLADISHMLECVS